MEAAGADTAIRLRLQWTGPATLDHAGVSTIRRSVGGVYVIQDHWPERRCYPIAYAGQANDLRARLAQHRREDGNRWVAHARHRRPLWFSYAPVDNQILRSAAEAALIWIFQPRYNGQVPGVEPLFISLPPYQEQ